MSTRHQLLRELRRRLDYAGAIDDELHEILTLIHDLLRGEVDAQPPDQGTQRLEPPSPG
jgi:hypothetical protein